MTENKKIKVGITLDNSTYKQLEKQSSMFGLSKSNYIQLLINSGVYESLIREERRKYLLDYNG